jgi:hypothetical protein
MSATRRISIVLLAFAAFAGRAGAQSPAVVRARLSTGVARLGSEVSLVVEVEGSQDSAIGDLPSVDGLRLGPVGIPSLGVFESIDGRRRVRTVKRTWVVPVVPEHAGSFTIPPITVTADGRNLSTPELALKVVEDLKGEDLGWFRIDAPREIYEGQPFTVELRFGYDSALGEIGEQINYINLSLPWLDQLPGLLELDLPAPASGAGWVEPVGLNSRGKTRAERLPPASENDRSFLLMRIRKRYLATRAGKLEFPTSHLEFGHVESGFFNFGSSEKHTFYKRFPAFAIDVLDQPEAGRPIDFSGAVGTLSARATLDHRDVDAGDSIKVSVEWTGEGNLEFFDPPDPSRMEAFKGFRLYGTNDRKTPERRVVIYDLSPISPDVAAIPPIPLTLFDPSKKAYASIATDAIPIRVRPLKKTSGITAETSRPEPGLDIRDIQTEPARERELPRPGGGTIVAALLGLTVLWFGLRTAVRRRGDPDAPLARARRAARRALRRDLAGARTASDQARALQRFLAARTGEPAPAWIGRDALAWARSDADDRREDRVEPWATGARGSARLPEEDARALAALMASLDERAWARSDEAIEAREIEGIAERLVRGGL